MKLKSHGNKSYTIWIPVLLITSIYQVCCKGDNIPKTEAISKRRFSKDLPKSYEFEVLPDDVRQRPVTVTAMFLWDIEARRNH